jgi:hypothetical protein
LIASRLLVLVVVAMENERPKSRRQRAKNRRLGEVAFDFTLFD